MKTCYKECRFYRGWYVNCKVSLIRKIAPFNISAEIFDTIKRRRVTSLPEYKLPWKYDKKSGQRRGLAQKKHIFRVHFFMRCKIHKTYMLSKKYLTIY